MEETFDIIVIGAGHAGAEAAHAAATLGAKTALITLDPNRIAWMSCNPAIGGLAKGQLAREVDALGGLMGLATDHAGLQFRILNRSKGPAVWGPRAQADIQLYSDAVRDLLAQTPNLTILPGCVDQLLTQNSRVTGIQLASGRTLKCQAAVLTAGTFLKGLMHLGQRTWPGGRYGEPAAQNLSDSLTAAGLQLDRLKTGTCPRLSAASLDFARLEPQHGDPEPAPFSFLHDSLHLDQLPCWIAYTNPASHEIIRQNLHRAPLYTGQITSTGPRYCPSVETKIVRFADKDRHQLFLEPQGRCSDWIYVNGLSTSLPRDVQDQLVHSIAGLENAKILRYGYAIEYDYAPPLQTRPTLAHKRLQGLFLAGQVNGTSGYEEAAAQGLLAGLNAARFVANLEGLTIARDQAYLGVMVDDLVTRGVDEPYRMFTSRAEHRLLLRADNADQRLTPLARQWGLIDDHRWQSYLHRRQQAARLLDLLDSRRHQGLSLAQWLCRPGHDRQWLAPLLPELAAFPAAVIDTTINDVRYAGYITRQQRLVDRMKKSENLRLPPTLDYHTIPHLRNEAKQRLNQIHPETLAQAARIPGINPADLTVLMIHLQKKPEIPAPPA